MNKQDKLEQFIIKQIDSCRNPDGRISWKKLIKYIEDSFPLENTNKERIRSLYRKHFDEKYREHQNLRDIQEMTRRENLSIDQVVLKLIRKKYAISSLAKKLDFPESEIIDVISDLQFEGHDIVLWTENGVRFVQASLKNRYSAEPTEHYLNQKNKGQIKIAVFSDTHIGHRQSAVEEVQYFIKKAYNQGVRNVFFAGDLVEGHYMTIRPTSIKELNAIGFDDQVDLASKVIPKLPGLTYYMISGNHDGTFARNAFANPIKTLAREREDIKYLGHNFAKIWLTDNIDIALVHPTDGIGQNYSLKMRQHIDRAREEKLAKFIFMGHYHKFDHTYYKGINGYIMPSFVKYTHFMDDKNLASIVGGIVLTINVSDNDEIISFLPEYFFFED